MTRNATSSDTSCGVVFVATGADYVDLARDAAQSVRTTNPALPIDLFTDLPDAAAATGRLFDQIHAVPHSHRRAKLWCMPASRFARTLFLDCDTRVLRSIVDLFALLERFDLAMAHDVRRASPLIQEGWREQTPYAFPQLNSGVVLYRQCPAVQAFFCDWQAMYAEAGVARDQVSLKDLLWRSDLRFYVLPPEYNLRRVTVLDAWEPLDARPSIIHSHVFLRHLRDPQARKVTEVAEVLALERAALHQEWRAWLAAHDGQRPALGPSWLTPDDDV
ncbi:MAG: putative nucleotide-diphospho-sugar transferase [Geminicoccaceae bacterium]